MKTKIQLSMSQDKELLALQLKLSKKHDIDNYIYVGILEESILEIFDNYIASIFSCNLKDFQSENNFPNIYNDNSVLIFEILFDCIKKCLYQHYQNAYIDIRSHTHYIHLQEISINNIKIQFANSEELYLTSAIEKLQNHFLKLLPQKQLFEFVKSLIFNAKYDEDIQKYNFPNNMINLNTTALVYFMQMDLRQLNMQDIINTRNDYNALFMEVNIFLDTSEDLKNRAKRIANFLKEFTINNSDNISKSNRLKRIFEVHLITKYSTKEISITSIYEQMLDKGFHFGTQTEKYDKNDKSSFNLEATAQAPHIKNDIKIIEKILDSKNLLSPAMKAIFTLNNIVAPTYKRVKVL